MVRHIIVLCISITLMLNSLRAQVSSNENSSNSSSILAMQQISVTIGGDFPISGSYPALRSERVDQLITRILVEYRSEILRTTPDEKLLAQMKKNINEFAQRNIRLKRFSGEEINIDLIKFRITGDFAYNPYLQNDDVLIFPALDLERNFVDISGAVNKETKFQFVEGDKLTDAIEMAHGINPAYKNPYGVQISRLTYDGTQEQLLNFNLEDNPSLERGDRIKILSDENKKRDYSVIVIGEVNRPGKIYISENNTSLKEVIEKAGGFTENASLKFAEVIRNYNTFTMLQKKAIEQKLNGVELSLLDEQKLLNFRSLELLKMYRSANITLEDTLFFNIDNNLRILEGYSQIDFRNISNENSFESKYRVKENDIIVIPEIRNEVYIWGGIGNSGYYEYGENKTVKNYIDEAGGYSEIAYSDDEIYLIKGKSREWINVDENENAKIEPGDYLYIKKDPPQSTGFYLSRIATFAGIIGSVATVVLLLTQIGK